jgi:CRP-like cAMP-binding protein
MIEFTQAVNTLFESEGKIIQLKKGELLVKEGQTEQHLYFVKEGAIRAFVQTEHEEHTIRFGYQGNIINSLASYISQQPSELSLEALKKTLVIALKKPQIESLIYSSHDHTKAYLQLIEQLIVQQIERETDLLIESPSVRLERVLKRSPLLFQHIPLKYIASYLRMSPETLSRIRKY